jgi:hypothetical protein
VDLEAHELGAVELPSLSRRLLFAAGRVESGRWMAITQDSTDGVRSLRSYVADWTVEVASEGARIGDPEVEWAWGGTALTLRIDAGPVANVYTARIVGEVATLSPTFETKRPGNTVTGVIDSPKGRTVAVDADAVLTAGRTHRIRPSGDVTVEITVGK